MQVSEKQKAAMHRVLPIDDDEVILAVYKHHWFAYVSLWVTAFFLVAAIIGLSAVLVVAGGENAALAPYKGVVMGLAVFVSAIILVATLIPAWLKSQEHLVLTEEAILQTLQPTLFAAKTSQLNLSHITDVTVRRDFFGTMLGYGHITIETPGEQDNYEFMMLPGPDVAARQIIAAHENYNAAAEGGRLPSTLGSPVVPAPEIDPQQYQEFLQYQRMVAQQQQDAAGTASDSSAPTDSSQQQ